MTVVPQVLIVERTTCTNKSSISNSKRGSSSSHNDSLSNILDNPSSGVASPTSISKTVCWLCCDSPDLSSSCLCAQLQASSASLKLHNKKQHAEEALKVPLKVPTARKSAAYTSYQNKPKPRASLSTTSYLSSLTPKMNGTTSGSSNPINGFNASNIVEDLLSKLDTTTNGSTNGSNQESLTKAQSDVDHLQAIQDLLQEKLEAKKTLVNELQIRVSPFLSFDEKLMTHFAGFLTEESLYALEQVMPQLVDTPPFYQQWKTLDAHRPFNSNAIDLTARERGMRFVQASQKALHMERSALYHYNPRRHLHTQYDWPEQLYTREQLCRDFSAWDNGDEPPPNLEFFVRLAYRKEDDDQAPTKVLMEGFLSNYSDLDPWDGVDQYTIIELDRDNTHVHMVCNDIHLWDSPQTMGLQVHRNWMRQLKMEWPRFEMKSYLQRCSLTVLACEPASSSPKLQSHLVVATRGFAKNHKELMAILPARPYLAKARQANLYDCVNVALKPTEETKGKVGFRIMVDWGTQDVFTRRKSILDGF